jgi:hypothetical protein
MLAGMENRPYDELAADIDFDLGKALRYVSTLRALAGKGRISKEQALQRVAKNVAELLERSNWRVRRGAPGAPDEPLPTRGRWPAEELAIDVRRGLEEALRDPAALPALAGKNRPAKEQAQGRAAAVIARELRANWWFRRGPPSRGTSGPVPPRGPLGPRPSWIPRDPRTDLDGT